MCGHCCFHLLLRSLSLFLGGVGKLLCAHPQGLAEHRKFCFFSDCQGQGWGGVLLMGGTGTISQRPELWSAHLVWAQASLRVLPQCPAWPIILGYRASAEKPSPTALLRIRCLETKHCRILEVNTWALWYFTEITDYVRFLLLFLRLYQQKSHENRFYMPSSLPQ